MLLRNKTILCIGGFDPSGCAGVLADLRMLQYLGAHSCALLTCHTVQNRTRYQASTAVSTADLRRQWRALVSQSKIDGIKIGAIANSAQADWLADAIASLAIPKVYDPVLNSSSGGALGSIAAAQGLIPLMSLSTPNYEEATALFGHPTEQQLYPLLITGTDSPQDSESNLIIHRLVGTTQAQSWSVARRDGQYRGSGCLLASAITAYLVAGMDINEACTQALSCVDDFLAHAQLFPDGVHIPRAPH